MSKRAERRVRRAEKVKMFREQINEGLKATKGKDMQKRINQVMTRLARAFPQERHLLTEAARAECLEFELDLAV